MTGFPSSQQARVVAKNNKYEGVISSKTPPYEGNFLLRD